MIGRVRDRLDLDRIDVGMLQGEGAIEFTRTHSSSASIQQLGPGWRQQQLSGVVSYGPNDNGVIIQDVIPAFSPRLERAPNSQSDDGPPLTNKLSRVIPVPILWNGVPSVTEMFPMIAVA